MLGKGIAEHRQTADGHLASCFVLDDVPVFGKTPVFNAHDVDDDPICRCRMLRARALCSASASYGHPFSVGGDARAGARTKNQLGNLARVRQERCMTRR
jgi:hypothetical protein